MTEYRYVKFLEIRYQEKCDELQAAHDQITYLRKKIEELEVTNKDLRETPPVCKCGRTMVGSTGILLNRLSWFYPVFNTEIDHDFMGDSASYHADRLQTKCRKLEAQNTQMDIERGEWALTVGRLTEERDDLVLRVTDLEDMVDEWRELCVRAEEEISELLRLPRDTDDLPDLIRDLREALTALPEKEVTQ